MYTHFVGVGSNIEPAQNIARGLQSLLSMSQRVHISSIRVTEPVDINGDAHFLNLALAFSSPLSPQALKVRFNQIEAALGRDRADPDRGKKSRTIDLDILFSLEALDGVDFDTLLPTEPYLRPQAQELMGYLGLTPQQKTLSLPSVAIGLDSLSIGRHPATIERDQVGHIHLNAAPDAAPCH